VATHWHRYSPASLISTQDTVTFIFYSDGTTTNAGWSALIDCVPPGAGGTLTRYDLSDGSPSISVSCGTPMSFYDGGGPHNVYPEAVDDTVTFIPANPTDRLMVAFPYQLSLSSGDTLWVYENTMTPNNLLALFTAGSSRAETLLTTASGNNLIFHFKSDFDGNVGPGWGAVISCAPASPPSPTTYMGRGVRTIACGTTYRFYDSGSPGLIAGSVRSDYGNYANNETTLSPSLARTRLSACDWSFPVSVLSQTLTGWKFMMALLPPARSLADGVEAPYLRLSSPLAPCSRHVSSAMQVSTPVAGLLPSDVQAFPLPLPIP
jgi:hypothetical protein